MLLDDIPWPELGNVSRGATRGNQGQKGAIGSPDPDGRSILQLRVLPGVLSVKLNRKASEWYRILDNEVNHALKQTKTYWRKARRRQDYDPRADQDHMELHEWLQQLKDKVMAHIELLMQKGDIPGPPYVMPDHLEFTFMRKFIERHAAGIPHNPRLRNIPMEERHRPPPTEDAGSDSTGPAAGATSEAGWTERPSVNGYTAHTPIASSVVAVSPTWPKFSFPDTLPVDLHTLVSRTEASGNNLRHARERLSVARANTQDAYAKYLNCMDVERTAQLEAVSAEEQRDDLYAQLLHRIVSSSSHGKRAENGTHPIEPSSAGGSAQGSHPRNGSPVPVNGTRPTDEGDRSNREWSVSDSVSDLDGHTRGATDRRASGSGPRVHSTIENAMMSPPRGSSPHRKHPREWEGPHHPPRDSDVRSGFPPSSKKSKHSNGSRTIQS